MFSTSVLNMKLKNLIEEVSDHTEHISDEELLKAYITFEEQGRTQNTVINADFYHSKIILDLYPSQGFDSLSESFLNYSFDYFVEDALYGYILSPKELLQHFKRSMSFNGDIILFTKHILIIKSLNLNYNSKLHYLYNDYLIETCRNSIAPISEEEFKKVYAYIHAVYLNDNEKNVELPIIAKGTLDAVESLNNTLLLSIDNQYLLCSDFYSGRLDIKKTIEMVRNNHFMTLTNEEIANELKNILRAFQNSSIIDLLQIISLSKKNYYYSNKVKGQRLLAKNQERLNDISLENSLIYQIYAQQISEKTDAIIVDPTVSFIRKFVKDKRLNEIKCSFAIRNQSLLELLKMYYSDPRACGIVPNNISFVSFDDLKKSGTTNKEKNILYFVRDSNEIDDSVVNLLNCCSHNKLFILASDQIIKGIITGGYSTKAKGILIIPRGISGSSTPKYKTMLVMEHDLFEQKTIVLSGKLLSDDTSQNIFLDYKNQLAINCFELEEKLSRATIRSLYSNSLIKRVSKANGRKASVPFNFTREIQLWCNMSNGSSETTRIEVFIRANHKTYSDKKGNRLVESIKSYSGVDESNLTHWIYEKYPYDYARKKGERISIRNVISEYYTNIWAGTDGIDLTFKTLWYIYPSLEQLFSESEYVLLSEMANSSLGNLSVKESTAAIITNSLVELYGDESETKQLERYNVLARFLSWAFDNGYSDHNELEEEIANHKISNKQYERIRNALTKKSLTEDEYKLIFSTVIENIKNGIFKNLGVLIKLFTGLESNVVCAIRWRDFEYIEDFDMYQIIVGRQLTNDGEEEIGFNRREDYRRVPCTRILSNILCSLRSKLVEEGAFIKDERILESLNRGPISPRELDTLSKELISDLAFSDIVIHVPDYKKGTKETNLTRYYGDIFRTNFKYWAIKIAKLNADETQYLLGNRAVTTFGIHYCDFSSDIAQALLAVKLYRIDSIFKEYYKDNIIPNCYAGEVFRDCEGVPLRLETNVKVKNDSLDSFVRIKGKHSLSIDIVKVTENK